MTKIITLFVLSSITSELGGQVIISNIRGPAAISNVHTENTGSSSILNVQTSYNKDPLNSKDSKASGSQLRDDQHFNYRDTPFFLDDDDDDDDDKEYEIDFGSKSDTSDTYEMENGPLIIHSVGPAGIWVQGVQNSPDQKSSVSITNLQKGNNYKEKTITVGPGGISIVKVNNGAQPYSKMDSDNKQQTHYSNKEEVLSVGPAGVYINKPTVGETIIVGPSGVFIQKVQHNEKETPIDGRQQHHNLPSKESLSVGPGGIFIQKFQKNRH